MDRFTDKKCGAAIEYRQTKLIEGLEISKQGQLLIIDSWNGTSTNKEMWERGTELNNEGKALRDKYRGG